MKRVGLFVLSFVFLLAVSGFVAAQDSKISEISFTPALPLDSLERISGVSVGESFAIYGGVNNGPEIHYIEYVLPENCQFYESGQGVGGKYVEGSEIRKVFSYSPNHNFKFHSFRCSVKGNYNFEVNLIDSDNEVLHTYVGDIEIIESNITLTKCVDSDGGVNPYILGECRDSRGVTVNDACLSENGEGPRESGAYVAEAFCLTEEMKEYCKQENGEEYCDNLPLDCYSASLIPESNLAWTYYERDEKYFCPNGCVDGVCVVETNVTISEPNTMTVDINKGWNLIYGFVDPEQIEDGSIREKNIKAIYALIPTLQDYARAWPDPEWDRLRLMDEDELLNTGTWVYSDRDGVIVYSLYTDFIPFYKREIHPEWNFIGITPEMISNVRLEKLTGSCEIRRSYIFDSNDQDWEELPLDIALDSEEAIGQTWVINVEGSCNLGETPSIIPAPPVLPEIGRDLDTDEPLEIGEWELIDVYSDSDCDGYEGGEICADMIGLKYRRTLDNGFEETARVSLMDYNKDTNTIKDYVDEYLMNIEFGLDNMYGLRDDEGLVWFTEEKYDLAVVEINGMVKVNSIVEYFYDKYGSIEVGLDPVERCTDYGYSCVSQELCAVEDSLPNYYCPQLSAVCCSGESCTDTDGGKNYYFQGQLTGKPNFEGPEVVTVSDCCIADGTTGGECLDKSNTLNEAYCNGNTLGWSTEICPNGCENGKCYYPGYFMNTDKDQYTPGESITLTLDQAGGGRAGKVDLYISPSFGYDSENYLVADGIIVNGSKDISIGTSEGVWWYAGAGQYMLLVCDAGAECYGGSNTNAMVVELI
jgi:hypothetical protein